MKTIKQYITDNKQLLIIYIFMILFLVIHNKAYCDPSLFQKWYLNVENYFLNLTWEKAISDPVEITKSVGWVSAGATISFVALEGVWNARRLGSLFLYNYTPLGHLDDGSGIIKSWFGFRNTAGPLKNIIDTVHYEEILPLHWARNYIFPNLFIQVKPNVEESNQIGTNPGLILTNAPSAPLINTSESQVVYRDRNIFVDTPISVVERVPYTVYVPHPVYNDRENLINLGEKTDRLAYVTAESTMLKIGYSNGYQQLREELNSIVASVEKQPSLLVKVSYEDELYFMYEFKNGSKSRIQHDNFNYPLIKELLLTLHEYNINNAPVEGAQNPLWLYYRDTTLPYLELKYTKRPLLSGGGSDLNYEGSLLGGIENMDPIPLFSEGIPFFLNNLTRVSLLGDEQSKLVQDLRQEIRNGLTLGETQNQSTQTANFDLNETIFDRINMFLEVRDETSFVVATNDGRNLPFNNLPVKNCAKNEKIIVRQTQEASLETQTEPTISENIGTLNVSAVNSSLFQNMGAFFGTVLVGAVARDFQTIELVARSLLGFIHIPEYNQAFLTATELSLADLRMEYNLSPADARKAFDALGQAYDMRNPGSNLSDLSPSLSDSNDYSNQAQNVSYTWNWKDYLLVGSGLIILGGSIYLAMQSIKTGTYTEGNHISPSVEAWKNAYFAKISKL